jgi:hypothetical protein
VLQISFIRGRASNAKKGVLRLGPISLAQSGTAMNEQRARPQDIEIAHRAVQDAETSALDEGLMLRSSTLTDRPPPTIPDAF